MAESPGDPDDPGADPRVLFAAERTLLAWVRTGLAMMGFGFVVARFGLFLREVAAARDPLPPHRGTATLWVGTVMVVLGVLVNVLSAVQHARTMRRLRGGLSLDPGRFPLGVALSFILAALGAALAAYLVLVP